MTKAQSQLRGESDPPPPSTPYKYECYEDSPGGVIVIGLVNP